jgi:divinyl protochlorophyllide a 8-vinyl-reductase
VGQAARIPSAGVIGPNAVTQLTQALRDLAGETALRRVFDIAGAAGWLTAPPQEMVPERAVAALHRQLRRELPPAEAARVAARAGRLTADYILANRIPPLMRRLLPGLPAPLAGRVLLTAIGRHAWTFAGSGRFAARPGCPSVIAIAGNPFIAGEIASAPLCHWHAAVFERLFQALVHPRAAALETACGATGAPACRFEVGWASR